MFTLLNQKTRCRLQNLAVLSAFYFPQLKPVLRSFYHASIFAFVSYVKRLKGVRSIYLAGSLPSGEWVPGLSDIDLIVITESSPLLKAKAEKKISSFFSLFNACFPVTFKPQELGVYTIDEFKLCYEISDWHIYRFSEGRKNWKLLFGKDCFGLLPERTNQEILLAALPELNAKWGSVVAGILEDDLAPKCLKTYAVYKNVADLSKIFLLAARRQTISSRKEALARMPALPHQDADVTMLCSMLSRAEKKGFINSDILPDTVISWAKLTIEKIYSEIKVILDAQEKRTIRLCQPRTFPNELIEEITGIKLSDVKEWFASGSGIKGISLIPQVNFNFSFNALMESGIDTFYLVIHAEKGAFPGRTGSRWEHSLLKIIPRGSGIIPYVLEGDIAYPITNGTVNYGHPIKSVFTDPIFFRMSGEEKHLICGKTKPYPGEDNIIYPASLIDTPISRHLKMLTSVIEDRSILRLKPLEFFSLFWTGLRTKHLFRTMSAEPLLIPVTSFDICRQIRDIYPKIDPWLEDIHQDYIRSRRGLPASSSSFKLFCLQILSDGFSGTISRSIPPTVSVVIITADRKEFLKECLDSLANQERLPEEVVVVDNGSAGTIRDVAESFRRTLNVKWVREPRKGIPFARNRGIQESSGEIIAFIDDDCVAEKEWLKELTEPFTFNPSIGIVGGEFSYERRANTLVEEYYIHANSSKRI